MRRIITFCCLLLMVASITQTPLLASESLVFEGSSYPLYPFILDEKPDIPSPCTTPDGAEYVVGIAGEGTYTIFPVTVENGGELNYKNNMWYSRGRQLDVDSLDFPTLAATGLHSIDELARTTTITGRSIDEITRIGRPERASGEGFLAQDEDIISVLTGDNVLVSRLALTHPELAKPVFHVFNVIQNVMKGQVHRKRGDSQAIFYNGNVVNLKFWGAKGWQESIFDDEVIGYYQIEIWREPADEDEAAIALLYPNASEEERAQILRELTYIHTGEMVAFYIMRYGFYEGHTGYRADPIAISSIFGLRTFEKIKDAFGDDLRSALMSHHVPDRKAESVRESND